MSKQIVFTLLALFVITINVDVAQSAKSCEVCNKVLQNLVNSMKATSKSFTPETIESEFISYCKNTKDNAENRFVSFLCFFGHYIKIHFLFIYFFVLALFAVLLFGRISRLGHQNFEQNVETAQLVEAGRQGLRRSAQSGRTNLRPAL